MTFRRFHVGRVVRSRTAFGSLVRMGRVRRPCWGAACKIYNGKQAMIKVEARLLFHGVLKD